MNTRKIRFPLDRDGARGLTAGDRVLISGRIVTGRDRVHQLLFNKKPERGSLPFPLEGGCLYHCGPIIVQDGGASRVLACGPTTSARVEMYEPFVIEHYGLSAVMGKGGMGHGTLKALQKCGAVYLHAIGGAAVYLARRVREVAGVWMLDEFGAAEAMWLFEVEDFPAVVTMDSRGNSLHEAVRLQSEKTYREIIGPGR